MDSSLMIIATGGLRETFSAVATFVRSIASVATSVVLHCERIRKGLHTTRNSAGIYCIPLIGKLVKTMSCTWKLYPRLESLVV